MFRGDRRSACGVTVTGVLVLLCFLANHVAVIGKFGQWAQLHTMVSHSAEVQMYVCVLIYLTVYMADRVVVLRW